MLTTKKTVTLQELLHVAFHFRDGEWWATALEFHHMAYGGTKEEALKLLEELMGVSLWQLSAWLAEGRSDVCLQVECDREDWETAEEIRTFKLAFAMHSEPDGAPDEIPLIELGALFGHADEEEETFFVEFVPA